jgi:hypothetical protein
MFATDRVATEPTTLLPHQSSRESTHGNRQIVVDLFQTNALAIVFGRKLELMPRQVKAFSGNTSFISGLAVRESLDFACILVPSYFNSYDLVLGT